MSTTTTTAPAGRYTGTGYALNGHDTQCTGRVLECVWENARDAGELDPTAPFGPDTLVWGARADHLGASYLENGDMACTCRTVEDERAIRAALRARSILVELPEAEFVQCLRDLQVPGADALWAAAAARADQRDQEHAAGEHPAGQVEALRGECRGCESAARHLAH